jgi:hypothetical protein
MRNGFGGGLMVRGALPPIVLSGAFLPLTAGHNPYFWNATQFQTLGTAPNEFQRMNQGGYLKFQSAVTGTLTLQGVPVQPNGSTSPGTALFATKDNVYNYSGTAGFSPNCDMPMVTPQAPGPGLPGVKQNVSLAVVAGSVYRIYTMLNGLTGITGTGVILPPTTPARSITMMGASGMMGLNAYNPTSFTASCFQFLDGWNFQWERTNRWDMMTVFAKLGASFSGADAPWGITNQATAEAFVDSVILPSLKGTSDRWFYQESGAGEYFASVNTPTQMTQIMGWMWDRITVKRPGTKFAAQSLIFMVSPAMGTANGLGFTQQQYSAAIDAFVVARPGSVLVKGYNGGANDAMSRAAADIADGLHMNFNRVAGKPGATSGGHCYGVEYVATLFP